MIKSKKGINLIKKNVDKFNDIIIELQRGIEFCEEDLQRNNTKIQTLTDENTTIEESKILASTFKVNLSNMLKIPTRTEKTED